MPIKQQRRFSLKMQDPDYAMAVLGVLMRREGRKSISVSYDELCAEPIQLLIENHPDGSLCISLPDQPLTAMEKVYLQAEACAAGKPVTRAIRKD